MTNDLIFGVISGIVASILVFVGSGFLRKVAIPYIKSLLFEVPDISGDWSSYDRPSEAKQRVGFARITQRNRRIEAEITRIIDRQGNETRKVFVAEGKFASGQLILMFEDKDMKSLIMGTAVFRLKPDNRTLEGKTMYFSDNEGCVITQDFYLKR